MARLRTDLPDNRSLAILLEIYKGLIYYNTSANYEKLKEG